MLEMIIATFITALGSDKFYERERSQAILECISNVIDVSKQLEKTIKNTKDLEVKYRANRILNRYKNPQSFILNYRPKFTSYNGRHDDFWKYLFYKNYEYVWQSDGKITVCPVSKDESEHSLSVELCTQMLIEHWFKQGDTNLKIRLRLTEMQIKEFFGVFYLPKDIPKQ